MNGKEKLVSDNDSITAKEAISDKEILKIARRRFEEMYYLLDSLDESEIRAALRQVKTFESKLPIPSKRFEGIDEELEWLEEFSSIIDTRKSILEDAYRVQEVLGYSSIFSNVSKFMEVMEKLNTNADE